MVPTNVIQLSPQTVVAAGNSGWFPTSNLSQLGADISVSALRGDTPTISFFLERLGADGVAYPVWSPTAFSAAGVKSESVGAGLHTDQMVGLQTRLSWTITGGAISTTVSTGATSATQALTSTAGMAAGDVLHFATANVNRTIDHVVDGTHVVLTASVASTTDEVVTVPATPDFAISASVCGK